jgi:hypothetical protein
MNIFVNLLVSLIHFILAYGILITAIVSNDLKQLIIILVIMILVKISFSIFGRCILTLYEYNSRFAPTAQLLSYTLTNKLKDDKTCEEILINVGILIILNKILFLMFYKYYIKN